MAHPSKRQHPPTIGDLLRSKIGAAHDEVGDALHEIKTAPLNAQENARIRSSRQHLWEAERHLSLAREALGPAPESP